MCHALMYECVEIAAHATDTRPLVFTLNFPTPQACCAGTPHIDGASGVRRCADRLRARGAGGLASGGIILDVRPAHEGACEDRHLRSLFPIALVVPTVAAEIANAGHGALEGITHPGPLAPAHKQRPRTQR